MSGLQKQTASTSGLIRSLIARIGDAKIVSRLKRRAVCNLLIGA